MGLRMWAIYDEFYTDLIMHLRCVSAAEHNLIYSPRFLNNYCALWVLKFSSLTGADNKRLC